MLYQHVSRVVTGADCFYLEYMDKYQLQIQMMLIIEGNNHTIYIDQQGATSGQIIDLCRQSTESSKMPGVLQMGHNTPKFF